MGDFGGTGSGRLAADLAMSLKDLFLPNAAQGFDDAGGSGASTLSSAAAFSVELSSCSAWASPSCKYARKLVSGEEGEAKVGDSEV